MKRIYKSCPPENTISRIRGILDEMGIPVRETKRTNPYDSLYSVRLETPPEFGGFGVNGKGLTRPYALASAYGEFMERIQNGMFLGNGFTRRIMENLHRRCGFYFAPDETFLDMAAFEALPPSVVHDLSPGGREGLRRYYERLAENGYPGCVALPFFDVLRRRTVHIPFNLLLTVTGSNGMCAGNSPEEAIYQGLCEVMERFCVKAVFTGGMTPPTVPPDYLLQLERESRQVNAGHPVHGTPRCVSSPVPGACPSARAARK